MLHNTQKMMSSIFIVIIVTILTLGFSSYSLVSAISSETSIDHHKATLKKQVSRSGADDGSSSKVTGNADSNDHGRGSRVSSKRDSSDASSSSRSSITNSDTTSSDNSNNVGDTENNNGNDNNQAASDDSNTVTRENLPSNPTTIFTPHIACDQGSNCNDQQDPNNTDHLTAPTATEQGQGDTPFVLSLPFP